jgi:hypothetical protein
MNPQKKEIARKISALFITLIHLQTQVVFAGVPSNPALLDNVPVTFLSTLVKNKIIPATGLILFKAFPYSNFIDPRGRTDIPSEESKSPPERVQAREDKQMSILKQMEELQIFQQETFGRRPQLPNSTPEILDGVSTYKLNANVAREMKKVQEDRLRTANGIENEIQMVRTNATRRLSLVYDSRSCGLDSWATLFGRERANHDRRYSQHQIR